MDHKKKFSQAGGVPSLFSDTIRDTQKLGNRKFSSTKKYIKQDIEIGQGIVGKDADLAGFGDVLKKVKKEDVKVQPGAIRKHIMVKQLSGRLNTGGRKKAFNIFAAIDDAIDNEPTDEAKEKARERAAAKKAAVEAPIPPKIVPPKIVRKKTNSIKTAEIPKSIWQNSSSQHPLEDKSATTYLKAESVTTNKDPIEVLGNAPAMFTSNVKLPSTVDKELAWETKLNDRQRSPAVTMQQGHSDLEPVSESLRRGHSSSVTAPCQPPREEAATNNDLRLESLTTIGDTIEVSESVPAMFTSSIKHGSPLNKEPAWKTRLKDRQPVHDVTRHQGHCDSEPVSESLSKGSLGQSGSVSSPCQSPRQETATNHDLKPTSSVKHEESSGNKQPAWKIKGRQNSPDVTKRHDHSDPKLVSESLSKGTLGHTFDIPAPSTFPSGPSGSNRNDPSDTSKEGDDNDDFSVSISSVESEKSEKEHDGDVDDNLDSEKTYPFVADHIITESVEKVSKVDESKETDCGVILPGHARSVPTGSGEPPQDKPLETDIISQDAGPTNDATYSGFAIKKTSATCIQKDDPGLTIITKALISPIAEAKPVEPTKPLHCEGEKADAATLMKTKNARQVTMQAPKPLVEGPESDEDLSESTSNDSKSSPLPFSLTVTEPNFSFDKGKQLVFMIPTASESDVTFSSEIQADGSLTTNMPIGSPDQNILTDLSSNGEAERLRERIKVTEKKSQAVQIDTRLKLVELRKSFENQKESMKESFEEKITALRQTQQKLDQEYQRVLNEEKQIVEKLRAENKQLRVTAEKIPRQIVETKQTIAGLEEANKEIAGHFESLSKFTRKLQADHDRLTESSAQCRDEFLPRYRNELRERQMHIDAETKIKTLYRDCIIKVAKHVGESKRPGGLAERINAIVLETEASVNPSFDPKILFASDSESSSSSDSSDSGSSSDSDSE